MGRRAGSCRSGSTSGGGRRHARRRCRAGHVGEQVASVLLDRRVRRRDAREQGRVPAIGVEPPHPLLGAGGEHAAPDPLAVYLTAAESYWRWSRAPDRRRGSAASRAGRSSGKSCRTRSRPVRTPCCHCSDRIRRPRVSGARGGRRVVAIAVVREPAAVLDAALQLALGAAQVAPLDRLQRGVWRLGPPGLTPPACRSPSSAGRRRCRRRCCRRRRSCPRSGPASRRRWRPRRRGSSQRRGRRQSRSARSGSSTRRGRRRSPPGAAGGSAGLASTSVSLT